MMWQRSIGAAVVLAALVAVFAAGEWAQRRAAQRDEVRERFLPQDGGTVERVEIQNEEGRIILEQAQDGWRMTEPVEDGADYSTVQTLLQFFNAALTTNRFEPRNLAEYGLDPPAVSATFVYADGDSATALFGAAAPQSNKVYATIEGSGEVFLVNRILRQNLEKPAFDFRDKSLLPALPESVMRVELENENGVMQAERDEPGGSWRLIQPLDYPADQSSIEALLRRMHINKFLAFVDPDDGATTDSAWVDSPTARLTVSWRPPLGDTAESATLLAGPKHPAADAWIAARSAGEEWIMIGREVMEELNRHPNEFRDKSLFTLRPEDVGKVEMTLGRETYMLERSDNGGWRFASDPATAVHQAGADLFLENLLALRADSFISDDPGPLAEYGLEPPRLIAVVHGVEGEVEGLSIGALSPEKSIVYLKKLGDSTVMGMKWTTLSSVYKFKIDLTDKRLLDSRAVNEEVVRIITTESGETRVLERRGDKVYMLGADGTGLGEVSPISALDYLTRIAALQFFRRVPQSEVTAADAGMDKPVLSIRLENRQGGVEAALEFGAMMDDRIFMRLNGDEIYLMKLDDWRDLTTLYRRMLQ